MYKITGIIGAVLETTIENDASYIDAGEGSDVLNIKGQSLAFDKGWFVIENPYTIVGAPNLSVLIGSKVVDACSNDEEITLKFDNDSVISISLKDEDFVGPEAASYTPKKGGIIVFD